MAFRIQDPSSGLFWAPGPDGTIGLASQGASYVHGDDGHIANQDTGLFVYFHSGPNVYESGYSGALLNFVWKFTEAGQFVNEIFGLGIILDYASQTLVIGPSENATAWTRVPVTRLQALLEKAAEPEPEDEVPDAPLETPQMTYTYNVK